jgi:ech hydrogenase subunit F
MLEMLKLITRNFFSKPATRPYPASERPAFERTRGRIVFDPENCILCSICARKCPADAITVDRATGKWELNSFRCITCGECVNGCPKKCITMSNERRHSAEKPEIITVHKEIPKPAPKPAAKPVQPAAPAPAAAESKEESAAVKEQG